MNLSAGCFTFRLIDKWISKKLCGKLLKGAYRFFVRFSIILLIDLKAIGKFSIDFKISAVKSFPQDFANLN